MTNLPDFLDAWRQLLAHPDEDRNREVDTASKFRCVYGVSEGQPLFFVVSSEKPQPLELADSVSVSVRQRTDGLWSLSFRLVDLALIPVFMHLCHQLAEVALAANTERELRSNLKRVVTLWRKLLRTNSSGLSDDALRGLVAELWVLDNIVTPLCVVPEVAVTAWEGPSGKPKDFVSGTGWAREVKAVGLQGGSVEIHGVDQLDDAGFESLHLDVVTTEMSPEGWTLPRIVTHLRARLGEEAAYLLDLKLAQIAPGYDLPVYAHRRVAIRRHRSIVVDATTPRITPEDLPQGINRVTYVLGLAGLPLVTDRPIKKDNQWTL